ncbi:MAG: AsmA-like C-terminal region-containing protein [Kiritimatiellia bacterium]
MRTAFRGEAESGAMILRGTAFDRVKARLDLNAEHTHIDDIDGRQEGRYIRGSYRNNRAEGIATLDLESTLNPEHIGRIIGPETERLMAAYPVTGNCRVTARGEVDHRNMTANRLVGSIDADHADIHGVQAENLTSWWTLTGDTATFPHIEAAVYGGKATGMFQIWPLRGATNRFFFASLQAEGVDLARHARPGKEPVAGLLTGNLMLEGPLGEHAAVEMKGGGRLELRKGALFQIKLFGGLSQYLSKLFPGFGYSSQTDLTATVDISGGAVSSPDVRLFGNVVSIFMRGKMTFDRQLSFDVEVKPLSEGFFSKALQIISWPVSKLFEFRLKGTLDNPQWRPNNLPKELFLKF